MAGDPRDGHVSLHHLGWHARILHLVEQVDSALEGTRAISLLCSAERKLLLAMQTSFATLRQRHLLHLAALLDVCTVLLEAQPGHPTWLQKKGGRCVSMSAVSAYK